MMTSFIITDAEYIVTGKTVTVNYTTDKQLRDVKITKDDKTYADPITFSQTSALFDISSWPNGAYTACKLRGWYNDNIPIMMTDKSSISINETTSTTLNVYLDRAPDYDITISVTSSDTNTVSVSPSSLKFTPSNYSTPQPITISGVHDSVDYNKNATVILSDVEMDTVTIPVTVINIDILYGDIVLSDTSLTINEKSSAVFTVKLASKPTNNQAVSLSSNNGNITLDKTSLIFTPANYDTVQTVTVTGGYNADTNKRTSTITASSTNVTSKTISVTINNIDVYGDIALNKTDISINEGESTTFTVKLASKPTNDQTVSLSSNNGNITLDKTSLIFTPANYDITQTVTVTGVVDDESYDNKTSIITASSPNVTNKTISVTIVNTTVDSIIVIADKQGYLTTYDGKLESNPYYVSTDFIDVHKMVTRGMSISVNSTTTNTLTYKFDTYTFYDSNRNFDIGTSMEDDTWTVLTFEATSIPSDTYYMRLTICHIDGTQISASNNAIITITPLT